MSPLNIHPALEVLKNHTDELGGLLKGVPNAPLPDDYIEQLLSFNKRTIEDFREAAKMAADHSKMFMQIAVAGLGALLAFTQLDLRSLLDPSSGRFYIGLLASLLFVASIYWGAIATSKIWKQGQGKINPDGIPWHTDHVKGPLNFQAIVGLAALVFFAIFLLWPVNKRPDLKGFTISTPGGTKHIFNEIIEIEGRWDELSIKDKTQVIVQLPPTGQGQNSLISIAPKP